MPTHEMNISGIKIGKRFREDVGDVSSLANSIKDIGLLHPVVVTHEYELIAGYRRIAAFKKLGRETIPVNIVNLDDIQTGECDENTVRKERLNSVMNLKE